MITLGVTGSIGMGKSTIMQLLRERDIPTYDADETVHRLMAPHGNAVSHLAKIFPHARATTSDHVPYIDRAKLATLLHDPKQLQLLEQIIHPLVFADMDDFKERMRQQNQELIALDIPLLFETKAEHKVDITLCVFAPALLQHQRVMARPGMTAEKFAAIHARQMPDAEKRSRADYVLDNDGTRTQLAARLDAILHIIRNTQKESLS